MPSPSSEPLRLEGVRVCYGSLAAVDGVDLTVGAGQVAALLGPSGCGKTTLLRAVAGLEPLVAGRIRLGGTDISDVPTHRRGVGLMFQDYALFPHRDVAANVAFGLRMRGQPRDAIAHRVTDVLDMVGLTGYEHRRVDQLSGGERQRVALARALAPSPRLLMLDEPLGSLDRTLRDRLVVELGELFTVLGITAVYVTHDQAEAFSVADQVVVMRAGQVVQAGTPSEVWRRPADGFVARLLGFSNLVDVTVASEVAATPWGQVPAPRVPDGPATALIRPAALRRGAGPVTGIASRCVFRGDHVEVSLVTDAGPTLIATVPPGEAPAVGERVVLGLDAGTIEVLKRGEVGPGAIG